ERRSFSGPRKAWPGTSWPVRSSPPPHRPGGSTTRRKWSPGQSKARRRAGGSVSWRVSGREESISEARTNITCGKLGRKQWDQYHHSPCRVIVLVRVPVMMKLVEMDVQLGMFGKQLVHGSVADLCTVEVERIQLGNRLQVSESIVRDGNVDEMNASQIGKFLENGNAG